MRDHKDDEDDLPRKVMDRQAIGVDATADGRARLLAALKNVRFVPLGIVLIMLGGVIGLYFQPPGLQKLFNETGLEPGAGTSHPIALRVAPSPADIIPQEQPIIGLGTLQPLDGILTIAPPFGAGDARLEALHVAEGDKVSSGNLLATLDNRTQLLSAVETARATLAVREASLAQTRSATNAARAEAEAALASAQATARNAAQEYKRGVELKQRGVIPQSVLDQRLAARDSAQRAVEQARATLSRYAGDNLDAQPDVQVAARNVEAARAELARATADLGKTEVRAFSGGTILKIHARPGEKPGAEGILTMGDLSQMVAEVEIYQTLVNRLPPHGVVTLSADALPQKLTGEITRVGLQVELQNRIGDDPAANTDARVVTVTVALDEASTAVAARFTNLQVTARIAPAAAQDASP